MASELYATFTSRKVLITIGVIVFLVVAGHRAWNCSATQRDVEILPGQVEQKVRAEQRFAGRPVEPTVGTVDEGERAIRQELDLLVGEPVEPRQRHLDELKPIVHESEVRGREVWDRVLRQIRKSK